MTRSSREGGWTLVIKPPQGTFLPGLEEVHLKPRTQGRSKERVSNLDTEKQKMPKSGTSHTHKVARDESKILSQDQEGIEAIH